MVNSSNFNPTSPTPKESAEAASKRPQGAPLGSDFRKSFDERQRRPSKDDMEKGTQQTARPSLFALSASKKTQHLSSEESITADASALPSAKPKKSGGAAPAAASAFSESSPSAGTTIPKQPKEKTQISDSIESAPLAKTPPKDALTADGDFATATPAKPKPFEESAEAGRTQKHFSTRLEKRDEIQALNRDDQTAEKNLDVKEKASAIAENRAAQKSKEYQDALAFSEDEEVVAADVEETLFGEGFQETRNLFGKKEPPPSPVGLKGAQQQSRNEPFSLEEEVMIAQATVPSPETAMAEKGVKAPSLEQLPSQQGSGPLPQKEGLFSMQRDAAPLPETRLAEQINQAGAVEAALLPTPSEKVPLPIKQGDAATRAELALSASGDLPTKDAKTPAKGEIPSSDSIAASALANAASSVVGTSEVQATTQEKSALPAQQMQILVEKLVEEMQVLTQGATTQTTLTLKEPPLLAGSTITLTTTEHASKEFNLSFANLSPEGQRLLDMHLKGQSLQNTLADRGFAVHIITTTTEKENIPTAQQPSQQQREDREEDQQQKKRDPREELEEEE